MNKKIKIGIFGFGLMGKQHAKAIFNSKKATLHSIIDTNKNSKKFSKKFKVPLFTDIKNLLTKKDKPDALIISTPNQFHKKHATLILKSKIPLLLEKPIADNVNSAIKIIKASKKYKTPLMIGYHRRYSSLTNDIKKIILSKKLGKIVSVNVICWFYKHKNYFDKKWRIKKGGGPLGINLVHDIDMISHLLGPIKYVQSFISNKNRFFNVEDTAVVSLYLKSGVLCTLNISDTIVSPWSYELTSGENPAYPLTDQNSYYIGGTKGSLQFPNIKYWYYKKERSWWKKIFYKKINKKKDKTSLINQINHFANVIDRKSKPKVTGLDGLYSLKIYEAILKSAKTGRKIKV